MSGQTIQVTTLSDSGAGSLRAAIIQADADDTTASSPDVVTFASGLSGSIDLQSPLPGVTDSLEIDGPGARLLELDAAAIPKTAAASVLSDYTPGSHLELYGLALDGADAHAYRGGFIDATDATVTLTDDTFAHDSAPGDREAGAGGGGAISAYGSTLTANGCTFSRDSGEYGGALLVNGGTLRVSDSTIANNSARGFGGGVDLVNATATITASTVSGNSVSYQGPGAGHFGYGGGIAALASTALALDSSIIASNHATGHHYGKPPYGGSNHRDIYLAYGSKLDAHFSLIQSDTAGLHLNRSDIIGKSPELGPLQDNGGPTNTEVPAGNSPVIDAGNAEGLTADQRGFRRTLPFPLLYARRVRVYTKRQQHTKRHQHTKRQPPPRYKVVHYWRVLVGTDIGAVQLQPYVIGPTPPVGSVGDQITVIGSGFSDAGAVYFGSQPATQFKVLNDRAIAVTVPAGAGNGSVSISVVTPAGLSASGPGDEFSYVTPL
jgi:hypothetical protein